MLSNRATLALAVARLPSKRKRAAHPPATSPSCGKLPDAWLVVKQVASPLQFPQTPKHGPPQQAKDARVCGFLEHLRAGVVELLGNARTAMRGAWGRRVPSAVTLLEINF